MDKGDSNKSDSSSGLGSGSKQCSQLKMQTLMLWTMETHQNSIQTIHNAQ